MRNEIKIDLGGFKAALKEYREYTQRDLATILNTKAFYIARGALRNTHRPTKEEIRRKLMEFVLGGHLTKSTVTRYTRGGMAYQAPLLALIINRNRGAEGKPGLYGAKMKRRMDSEIGRRYASIAFIAAGFLPAVKKFEGLAEQKGKAPPRDPMVKQRGQPKGSGIPAREGWKPFALIINDASARGDHRGALEEFGGDGLYRAVQDEVASMKQFIEDKLNGTAQRVNAKRK